MKYIGKKTVDYILNAIFPQQCLGCKKQDTELCSNCLKSILSPEFLPTQNQIQLLSVGNYSTPLLQKAIKQLKFHGQHSLGAPLGSILAVVIANNSVIANTDTTIVIPIPLHKKRLQERGYNQAASIAKPVAKLLNVKYIDTLITRAVSKGRHADMEHEERWKHIEGAFALKQQTTEQVAGKHILLVDDVVTTGATALEAANILLNAGAHRITICAVARSK